MAAKGGIEVAKPETHPHGFDSRRGRRAMNEYAEELAVEENAR
jgi:hypothetical protein